MAGPSHFFRELGTPKTVIWHPPRQLGSKESITRHLRGILNGGRKVARFNSAKRLAWLADKWKTDPRPWARQQILRYLEGPLDRPGHEPIIKRMFKHAEAKQDDELMAAFLVAFDRLVRRRRKTRWHYDRASRSYLEEEELVAPRDRVYSDQHLISAVNPKTLQRIEVPRRPSAVVRKGRGHLFSYRTRYYLRRRAWRYFRWMGFQRPGDYVKSVAAVLQRYRDEDFVAGENILDSWSLLHICFHHHEALQFGASTVWVREGHSLGALQPAPRFRALWRGASALGVLLDLVAQAPSRLVRVWAIAWLRKEHADALRTVETERLLKLLDHPDTEVQQFAAEVFGGLAELDKFGLDTWLKLLQAQNPQVLAVICAAMSRHVAPERLNLSQCIDLACAEPTPVARLGLALLRQRQVSDGEIRGELVRLAEVRCAAIGGEVTGWALQRLGAPAHYTREALLGFFDSLVPTVRTAALTWLRPDSPAYVDPVLWAALIETPFDDVRHYLINTLTQRSRIPGAKPDDLAPVWCSVVLGVHRGGRQKPKAVRQLATAIEEEPARLARFGPLLAVAVRSLRGPERRAGLAAVARLVERIPALAAEMEALLPGLQLAGLAEGPAR